MGDLLAFYPRLPLSHCAMDVPGKTARIIRISETGHRRLSEFFRRRRNFAVNDSGFRNRLRAGAKGKQPNAAGPAAA